MDAGDLRGVDGEEHGECEAEEDGGGVEGELAVEGWHGHYFARWSEDGRWGGGAVGDCVPACEGSEGEEGEDGDEGGGEEVEECRCGGGLGRWDGGRGVRG